MESLTPMLRQYNQIKNQHKDCILFFRLGDFYEMFYDDAKDASSILNVVLTSRGKTPSGRIPMCGIPFHAADAYISKLIKAGRKIAICEQVENPALAKGIVRRQVIRVVTSGTFIDENTPEPRCILAIIVNNKSSAVSFTDTTSGVIQSCEYPDIQKTVEVISKLPVYECVFPADQEKIIKEIFNHPLLRTKNITFSAYEDWAFNLDTAQKALTEHFSTLNLRGFGLGDMPLAAGASGALLAYLKQMHQRPMQHIDRLSVYSDDDCVFISPSAIYGLNLKELFEAVDHTHTAMGKRKLKDWLYHPLKSKQAIISRQEAIKLLKDNPKAQDEIGALLRGMPDIPKSLSKIACGYTAVKDLLILRNSLLSLPRLNNAVCGLSDKNPYFNLCDAPLIRRLLEEAIASDVPLSNPEGKIIRKGCHQELDSLRGIQENFRQWLKDFQARQIKHTGINSLKVGYNQVFGYYIEISNANLNLVPAFYIRRQTLTNGERFITPELKEFEEKFLTAQEKILKIENELLEQIYKKILEAASQLHQFADGIATIDVLYSLSILAGSFGYICPQITEDTNIILKDARHPVVEKNPDISFVPNDAVLDCGQNHLIILTGPNMAGKSTYIRQTALLVIMAQMGSFIPASYGSIGIVDKIFTRIGAHDEISRGQSTFMVEMSEAAGILNNLTPRSLIILDEIGRGTSTYDGLSLAWAIAEYLNKQKVRTLFATHFHELTALAQENPGIKNFNVAVKEWNDEIIFLHKIVPGGTDESYGIYVAKLAGIPQDVVGRARQILGRLEQYGKRGQASFLQDKNSGENQPVPFFPKHEQIGNEIKNTDIDSLKPIDALNKIQKWKELLENE